MKFPRLTPASFALVTLSGSLFFASSAAAQTVSYDFNDQPGSIAAATTSSTDQGYSASLSLVGYADKTSAAGVSIQWTNHTPTLNTGNYLQVGVTNESVPFNLTNFAFTPKSFRFEESAKIEVRFSTKDGAAFDTDYVTVWSSVTRYTAGNTPVSIPLSTLEFAEEMQGLTAGYFRIYTFDSWKASTAIPNPGSWLGVDDIQITATPTIPEPATAAVMMGAAALAGTVALRRSRAGN